MTIYIVRHGESTWNIQLRVQGNKNPGLSAKGLKQARLTAKCFNRAKIVRIFSSPLKRAYQTARCIAETTGVPLERADGLREIMLGAIEGLTTKEVEKQYPGFWDRWADRPASVRIPGAETFHAFRKRVGKAFLSIVRKCGEDESIVIVAHGGAIGALLSYLLDFDVNNIWSLTSSNAGVTTIKKYGSRFYVQCFNDTNHLERGKYSPYWPA
jgi:phosphoserine phosphatase